VVAVVIRCGPSSFTQINNQLSTYTTILIITHQRELWMDWMTMMRKGECSSSSEGVETSDDNKVRSGGDVNKRARSVAGDDNVDNLGKKFVLLEHVMES
jgi:hypothetical protein